MIFDLYLEIPIFTLEIQLLSLESNFCLRILLLILYQGSNSYRKILTVTSEFQHLS